MIKDILERWMPKKKEREKRAEFWKNVKFQKQL